MTIQAKILVPMLILTVVIVAAILVSNIFQFSDYVDVAMEDRVNSAADAAPRPAIPAYCGM